MMEKQQCLHELDKYLPDYVDIETLVILGLNVTVDVHTQHFCYDTLYS